MKLNFQAEVATTWDNQFVVLESVYSMEHCHPPDEKANRDLLIKLHVTKLWQMNPDAEPPAIVRRVQEVHGKIDHVK